MDISDLLTAAEQLRATLDQWGVTNTALIITGTLAFVFMILSLRELLAWFLRVQHLRDEVADLRRQTTAMTQTLNALRVDLAKAVEASDENTDDVEREPTSEDDESKPGAQKRALFRLDH